jgi:hypothetical protein
LAGRQPKNLHPSRSPRLLFILCSPGRVVCCLIAPFHLFHLFYGVIPLSSYLLVFTANPRPTLSKPEGPSGWPLDFKLLARFDSSFSRTFELYIPTPPFINSFIPSELLYHFLFPAPPFDISMPYNNSAIPPPSEITGQASLPCLSLAPPRLGIQLTSSLVARVKRIISLDEDVNQCSNNAAFVITVAKVSPIFPKLVRGSLLTDLRRCLFDISPSKAIMWRDQKENHEGTFSTMT